MKKIAVFFLLSFVTISFAQTFSPKITTKENHHDFGTIVEGQIVTYNYEVKNEGSGVLTIDQVHASCGCTAAQPDKKELKPGEKTSIRVEFDSANRMGPQEKTVYVMSNDLANPELKLTFNCVIVEKNVTPKDGKTPKLKLSVNKHDFGKVAEGKIAKATIRFKNTGEGVLTISNVKTSCECAVASISSKTLIANQSGSIKIELDTSGRLGTLTRTVTLYSNDPTEPDQTITLFVNIQPRKK
jgi:hypothetical protein